MRSASLTALLLMALSGAAAAQWVPVSGRIVTTTQVLNADGSIANKWTTSSRYSRSSSGSVLVQHIGRSGKPATATLLDYGGSQKVFTFAYQNGQVVDKHLPLDRGYASHPPTGITNVQKTISLGTDKVNGVDCFIVPVYDVGPNRTRVLIGKAWLAPAYNNLVMREDTVRTSPFGGKRHIVKEMKISSQNEPDASLFSTDRKVVASQWKVPPAGN
jgi:hypothetical protein